MRIVMEVASFVGWFAFGLLLWANTGSNVMNRKRIKALQSDVNFYRSGLIIYGEHLKALREIQGSLSDNHHERLKLLEHRAEAHARYMRLAVATGDRQLSRLNKAAHRHADMHEAPRDVHVTIDGKDMP